MFLHERGSAWHGWGWSIGQGLILGQPRQVTLSDVTTLPEVSISVYCAGSPFGTLKIFDWFFVFLHECGSAWHRWGWSIGQGLILGQPRQVTLSDVTKLLEVSTSSYGAGSSFGTRQKFDLFFGLPLWYTYRIFNHGGHLVLDRILGTLSLLRKDAESVPLPIKRLPKHIYGSFAGIPTRKISHGFIFTERRCWGLEKIGPFITCS